jgi:hypothetical protein
MIFQSKISKVICFWILSISITLSVLILNEGLQGINIYRFGPNPDLYILGFCIDNYEKYISVAVFCFINSGMRTLNNEILHLFALKMRKGNVTFHSFTPTKWAF